MRVLLLGLVLALLAAQGMVRQAALAQAYVEGTHYWFEEADFPSGKPVTGHPYGPEKARGLVIWNDGYSPDRGAPMKVPPVVQYFAEAGWDAHNLRRHSGVQGDQVANLIFATIDVAKRKGYRRILLFGQSRGAYASIQVGSYRPDILGILPLAPAGFGDYARASDFRQNDYAIRPLWDRYKNSGIRVAAGFFAGDDWYETKVPNTRGPYAKKRLDELGVANFIINEPAYPKMQTHSGGTSWEFARRFGPCLEHFYETGAAISCRDDDPATAAIFNIALPELSAAAKAAVAAGHPYLGLWQGTWQFGRFAALAVTAVNGDKAEATYIIGKGVFADKPESSSMPLVIGQGYAERPGRVSFRFTPQPDGSLLCERSDKSKPEAPPLTLRLYRVLGAGPG
jgi:hypothetical protein